MTLIAVDNTNPFNSIRRTDEQGEYWLARELMPLLGYQQWRQFSEAIEKAIIAQNNCGNDVAMHFLRYVASTKGRPREDYRPSRKAIDWVIQNTSFYKRFGQTTTHESFYRDNLAKKLKGQAEILTPAGAIDILTCTEVIEVKKVKHWKSAIGQVEVYSDYFPSHQKRIHLIGIPHLKVTEVIETHCKKRGIKVSYESDVSFEGES